VALAGVLGGVMRAPLTGVAFAVELTHRLDAVLPLLVGASAAYALSVVFLKRSVLTEKIARRGLHLSREYDVDPLEVLLVGEVMAGEPLDAEPTAPVAYPTETLRAVAYRMAESGFTELPVVAAPDDRRLVGVITLPQLLEGRLRDLREARHAERVLTLWPVQRLPSMCAGRRRPGER
jgi:hypothetical protein